MKTSQRDLSMECWSWKQNVCLGCIGGDHGNWEPVIQLEGFVGWIHDSLLQGLDAMQAVDITVFAGLQAMGKTSSGRQYYPTT